MHKENKLTKNFIIVTFVLLYVMVSIISTIHVIDFFKLSNPDWLAITLAIAFEVGAAASLASIIALQKMNKGIVWALFFILTAMQAMGNAYYAYVHLENYQAWIELFGLVEEEPIFQKRILSIVSGAILPLVALGFIKSLVDYIKPNDNDLLEAVVNDQITDSVTVESPVSDVVENEESDNIVEKIRKENVEKYIESLDEAEDITPEENTQEIVENVVQINEDDEKKN
jgi:hypothetical protein